MREILFKAKTIDTNKWVEGDLLQELGKCRIFKKSKHYVKDVLHDTIDEVIEVIPETLCQYTGLKDVEGNKIFEGDKVLVPYNYIGIVNCKYDNGKFNISDYNIDKLKITGNIHD